MGDKTVLTTLFIKIMCDILNFIKTQNLEDGLNLSYYFQWFIEFSDCLSVN